MKKNVPAKMAPVFTHEGGRAKQISSDMQLRRSIMAHMLWENSFYENGEDPAMRIAALVPQVDPFKVAAMAYDARTSMKLRHVPLLVIREMARHPKHKALVSQLLFDVIQRADELAEFLAIYWKDGRTPISAQVKKGLAKAFLRFNAYQLAKYNRDNAIKLRDVLFMVHAKPQDKEQQKLWKDLIDDKLPIPNTWETRLSSGEDKKTVWMDLLSTNALGALALLRNLRNMQEVGVPLSAIKKAISTMKTDRVLPYRFIAAARYAPTLEPELEAAMFRSLEVVGKFHDKTVLLVDVSGSMSDPISAKSDMTRFDAASGLAVLARELIDNLEIYTFSDRVVQVPNRRGFALRDAIVNSQPHGGTYLANAVEAINRKTQYDRIIVFTDEQSHDGIATPNGKGYVINVASYENGVGYGQWTHIDGFSEHVFDYIEEFEK